MKQVMGPAGYNVPLTRSLSTSLEWVRERERELQKWNKQEVNERDGWKIGDSKWNWWLVNEDSPPEIKEDELSGLGINSISL
jgi:hypothetical protein